MLKKGMTENRFILTKRMFSWCMKKAVMKGVSQ